MSEWQSGKPVYNPRGDVAAWKATASQLVRQIDNLALESCEYDRDISDSIQRLLLMIERAPFERMYMLGSYQMMASMKAMSDDK